MAADAWVISGIRVSLLVCTVKEKLILGYQHQTWYTYMYSMTELGID